MAAALRYVLPEVDFIGGVIAPATDGLGRLYHNGKFHENSVVIHLLGMPAGMELFTQFPGAQKGHSFVVTEVDDSHCGLISLEGLPAQSVYANALKCKVDDLTNTVLQSHPLAFRVGSTLCARRVVRCEASGILRLSACVSEGMLLDIAELDPSAVQLLKPTDPSFVFVDQEIEARASLSSNAWGLVCQGQVLNGLNLNQSMTGVSLNQ